jgi:hypothetical protein
MDRAAKAKHLGNTAHDASIQMLIKKFSRRDKAAHTKKAVAESAQDRPGKLLYNNIQNTKKGFTSKNLCLSKNGTPQQMEKKAHIFAEHLRHHQWAPTAPTMTQKHQQQQQPEPTQHHIDENHPPPASPTLSLPIDVSPFSFQEILQALAPFKKGKAPGPDRIPMDLIKCLDAKNLPIVM